MVCYHLHYFAFSRSLFSDLGSDEKLGFRLLYRINFLSFQKTGKEFAIKVFNHRNAGGRFAAARKREFEVLKKVNHENVIRMFTVEEEVRL